jgi:hypothetical protein
MRNHGRATDVGFLGKLLSLVGGIVFVILAVMFSVVALAVIAVVGIGIWIYFWWKTRELRHAIRERPPGGHVIDGEVVVVDEAGSDPPRHLPRDGS